METARDSHMTAPPATTARYALYLMPPEQHPLWASGCTWLGRRLSTAEPDRGAACRWVTRPWLYGFHATLKAPMHLAPGVTEADLLGQVRALAARHVAFQVPPLVVGWLSDFLVLRPQGRQGPRHPLCQLADDGVRSLEPLRAALSPEERHRRLSEALDDRQRELLEHFGYPHVLDRWRFHLTLTNGLGDADLADVVALKRQARRHFAAALDEPWRCDTVALCTQPHPGDPFEIVERLPLASL